MIAPAIDGPMVWFIQGERKENEMNANEAIQNNIDLCRMVLGQWISDFSDADLMVRPLPEANHAAWQIGHLIASEVQLVAQLGHSMPELPEGFAESHGKEACTSDDPSKFLKKDEYMALMSKVSAATLAGLAATPAADLDKPGPEAMREIAPTVGSLFGLVGTHLLMHGGQFVVTRRKLGKPILF